MTTPKDRIHDYFQQLAPSYDRVGPAWFSEFGRRLVDVADVRPGARVLDVATGRGAVLFAAAAKAGPKGETIGIDLSAEMVRNTKHELTGQGITNARVRVMDAEQLTFRDNYFHYVLCGFALFFLPDLPAALAQFRRVLRPGGVFAATTWSSAFDPRWLWYRELLDRYGQHNPTLNVQTLNTPELLRSALEQARFFDVQVRQESASFHYQDEHEWWQQQIAYNSRHDLSGIDPARLSQFQAEAIEGAAKMKGPGGIPITFNVLFARAVKPGI